MSDIEWFNFTICHKFIVPRCFRQSLLIAKKRMGIHSIGLGYTRQYLNYYITDELGGCGIVNVLMIVKSSFHVYRIRYGYAMTHITPTIQQNL